MQMLKNWNPEQIPEKEDIKVLQEPDYMSCRWL